MNKRPESVRVADVQYAIIYTKKDYDLGDDAYGIILHEKCLIKILKTCPEDIVKHTVWHEVLHAIYYWYDIQDEDTEERVVSKVALGTYRTLLENPELMEYLTASR